MERADPKKGHSFTGKEREVDATIHQREKHVQSFCEANTLGIGSFLVEGEAELLAAHLSDNRTQLFTIFNLVMARGMERVEGGGCTWVGGGRVPYGYITDS